MAAAATISDILKLRPNVPETIALQYSDGRLCSNGSFLYTLTDGRKLFADVPCMQAIEAAHVTARVPFTIAKLPGGRWHVETLGNPKNAGTVAAVPASSAGYQTKSNNRPSDSTPAPHAELRRLLDSPRDEFDEPQASGASRVLAQSLCDAMTAVQQSYAFASSHGFPVTFSEESVRAMAISLFIEASRRGVQVHT